MTIKDKARELVAKYGFTLRGLLIATAVFPPAGAYVAWRMPNYPLPVRLLLAAIALILPLMLPMGLIGAIWYAASWISGHFG